jgi:putative tricarboxylic transport membrane protein
MIPYALVGTASGYLYYVATNFEFHRRAGTLGPDFWPEAILILMIATCIFEIVRIALSPRSDAPIASVLEDMVEESAEAESGAESHPVLLLLGMAATLGYVAVVQVLGFFLSTVIYLAAFLVIGRYRRWGVIAGVSVTGALVLMFIFMKLVYVSLPIGQGPFAEVTLFLMNVMGIR